MAGESLEVAEWRVFRLFLMTLEEAGLEHAYQQLQEEMATRRQWEQDTVRLFFSSLPAGDLERARAEIVNEQEARTEDRRIVATWAAAETAADAAAGSSADSTCFVQPDRGMNRQDAPACAPERMIIPVFVISAEDRVTVFASASDVPAGGGEPFSSEQELSRLAAGWPLSRLVAAWNHWPGVQPVRRFTDRATAVRRLWRLLQQQEDGGEGRHKAARRHRNAPRVPVIAEGTKGAEVLRLLRQPGGATLQTLMSATGWQPHSVRGFISRTAKRQRLKVRSVRTAEGRLYSMRP